MIRQVGNGAVRQFCEVTEDPETPPPGHAPPHTPAKVLYRKTFLLLLVFIFVKMVYSMATQKKQTQKKKKTDLLSKYWFKAYSSLLPPTQATGWSVPILQDIHLEGYCTYPTTTGTVHCQLLPAWTLAVPPPQALWARPPPFPPVAVLASLGERQNVKCWQEAVWISSCLRFLL